MKDKNVLIMGALDGGVAGQSPRQPGSPRIHVGSRGPPRACGCQPGAPLIAARSCPGIVLNIARAGLNLRLGFCRVPDRFSIAGAYRPQVHTGLRVHSALRVRTAHCCGSRLASKPAPGGGLARRLGAGHCGQQVCCSQGRETSLTSATPDPLEIFVLSCGTNSGRSVARAASFLAGISWIATVGASM